MTYGDHQEAASQALLRLLDLGDEGVIEREHAIAVLAIRHQIHLALEERLNLMDGGADRVRHRTDRTISAAKHPVQVLRSVLDGRPRTPDFDRAPTDVLAHRPDRTSEALAQWCATARHLTLGNGDLATTLPGVPQQHPASWYLLGDLSLTLEAIVVLDASLRSRHVLPPAADADLAARLATGGVTRVAAWRGTDPSLDFAIRPVTEASFADDGPRVCLIRRPEDYVAAQRALAGFMRPRPLEETQHPLDERPGLHAARVIAEGQVRLAEAFATWAERADELTLAARFRARIPKYVELHRSTLRLTELRKTRPVLVDLQQSEMTHQLWKVRTSPVSRIALYDLDAATSDVAINVGKSLRREGMRRRNILILSTTGDGYARSRPITSTRNRFNLACRALARDTDRTPATTATLRESRTELARALTR